jgi:hypothetical protein
MWRGHGWRDETAGDAAVPDASNHHDGTSLHYRGTAPTLRFPRLDLTLRHRPTPLNAASSMTSAHHSPSSSTTIAPKNTFPAPWILLPPPLPPDPQAQERSAAGARRAAGTCQRFPPSGRPELEPPCALGRRRKPRRPGDLQGFDPSGSCTRRCSGRAVTTCGGNAGSPLRGEH